MDKKQKARIQKRFEKLPDHVHFCLGNQMKILHELLEQKQRLSEGVEVMSVLLQISEDIYITQLECKGMLNLRVKHN